MRTLVLFTLLAGLSVSAATLAIGADSKGAPNFVIILADDNDKETNGTLDWIAQSPHYSPFFGISFHFLLVIRDCRELSRIP